MCDCNGLINALHIIKTARLYNLLADRAQKIAGEKEV